MVASWRSLMRRVDSFHGVDTLRTLRGLDSWRLRWTFARFVVETRLGMPYRGALAPTETNAQVTRDGYRFEPRDGCADREVLWPFHEVQTRWFLRQRFARKRAGGVFVDVFDRVLSLEPLPDNYRAIERNIALNELQRKIRPFNVAAGKARAIGPLFVKGDETSSLVCVDRFSGTVDVSIWPLDDLLSDQGVLASDVRLLKVDVEGAETEVLAGARRLLEEGSAVVVLEALTAAAKANLETRMTQLGYVLICVADGRNLCFERFHGHRVA
jgi:FkbM family methyltransferase